MIITLFLILKTGTQNWTPYKITPENNAISIDNQQIKLLNPYQKREHRTGHPNKQPHKQVPSQDGACFFIFISNSPIPPQSHPPIQNRPWFCAIAQNINKHFFTTVKSKQNFLRIHKAKSSKTRRKTTKKTLLNCKKEQKIAITKLSPPNN